MEAMHSATTALTNVCTAEPPSSRSAGSAAAVLRPSCYRSLTAMHLYGWCPGQNAHVSYGRRFERRRWRPLLQCWVRARLLEALAYSLPPAVAGPAVAPRAPSTPADAHLASLLAAFWPNALVVAAMYDACRASQVEPPPPPSWHGA